ncbi:MAG TPA: crosslink repair DNA glycosylase YcaQ family protein [Candidatus Methylomirabilis sp.]|nr:crosslink repair DNA glycosylase YcaQ family protein [Candidatus Methylomirabilis sp.]
MRSAPEALRFVNAVGLCSTFYTFPDGPPSLWEAVVGRPKPRWPRRSHHDTGVGLTWELKDVLPRRREVYYGKLVQGRPVLVALDLFPAFYALVRGRQTAKDYAREYAAGRMSLTARRIMDNLMRESPQYTRGLRAECFMLEPSKTREFERAMAELQQGLWIVKTEERYEPTFSYRWDLLERWLPDAVAEGRRMGRPAALDQVVTRFLHAAVFARPAALARLLAVPRREVDATLARLARQRVLITGAQVSGRPGQLAVSVSTRP